VAAEVETDRVLPVRLEGRIGRSLRAVWGATVLALAVLGTAGFVQVTRDPWIIAMRPAADLLGGQGAGPLVVACLLTAPAVASLALCAVVWRRRPDDPMALLLSLTTMLLFTFGSRTLLAFRDVTGLRHAFPLVGVAALVGLLAVAATFPDGRSVPRAARWLPLLAAAIFLVVPDAIWAGETTLQGDLAASGRTLGVWIGIFGLMGTGAAAQIHRYRWVSGPTERQQARWVVLPFGLLMAVVALALVTGLLGDGAEPWLGWLLLTSLAGTTTVPLAIGNALLRHRLWDLDRLVSRTVTYAVVVVTLGVFYAGAVTALGALVSRIGGGDADLAVAVSVLLVAAIFHPLRSRVRAVVDRRFDRTGIERRLALQDLATDLREQVELDAIRTRVVHTTDQLVRPSQVTVWLAPRGRR
jgi:hypothetical protein